MTHPAIEKLARAMYVLDPEYVFREGDKIPREPEPWESISEWNRRPYFKQACVAYRHILSESPSSEMIAAYGDTPVSGEHGDYREDAFTAYEAMNRARLQELNIDINNERR